MINNAEASTSSLGLGPYLSLMRDAWPHLHLDDHSESGDGVDMEDNVEEGEGDGEEDGIPRISEEEDDDEDDGDDDDDAEDGEGEDSEEETIAQREVDRLMRGLRAKKETSVRNQRERRDVEMSPFFAKNRNDLLLENGLPKYEDYFCLPCSCQQGSLVETSSVDCHHGSGIINAEMVDVETSSISNGNNNRNSKGDVKECGGTSSGGGQEEESFDVEMETCDMGNERRKRKRMTGLDEKISVGNIAYCSEDVHSNSSASSGHSNTRNSSASRREGSKQRIASSKTSPLIDEDGENKNEETANGSNNGKSKLIPNKKGDVNGERMGMMRKMEERELKLRALEQRVFRHVGM